MGTEAVMCSQLAVLSGRSERRKKEESNKLETKRGREEKGKEKLPPVQMAPHL
jgi:hypothetical protein